MSKYSKAIVALVPLVLTLVAHFAGADSDAYFVAGAIVTALTAAGVYAIPNQVA